MPRLEPVPEPKARPLPRRDLAFTQAFAGDQIASLGYELRPVPMSMKERLLFNLLDKPANLASLFAWRTKRAIQA